MPDGFVYDSNAQAALFDRLPPEILGSLTVQQKNAIASAAGSTDWKGHPVNIRLSLPFLPRRWYVTIVSGPERRARDRRRRDRTINPIRTAGNLVFILCSAILFYGIAIGTFLVSSSVIDY
jgi:hypothetical protein